MNNITDFIMPVFYTLVIIIAIVTLYRYLRSGSTVKPGKRMTYSLEQKLEILADCGFKLATPFTVDELLTSWDRDAFELLGFDLVLVGLGMTEEREPWRNHCVNLWHFDTECIEDHGDYQRIVERMVEMIQGALVLENIEDYVDVENKIAWLSFTFQGEKIQLELTVNNDWVDWQVFHKLSEILQMAGSKQLFVYHNLGGQDGLIGCVSQDQLAKLNANDINFVPL